ncbi:hypothetical protein GGR50DRAFT_548719 [Xylaria sp. CBS 124048]|nr:hypothetical protein GGR50DRAFT_548719 [Xylaria sp. CBS 124048]
MVNYICFLFYAGPDHFLSVTAALTGPNSMDPVPRRPYMWAVGFDVLIKDLRTWRCASDPFHRHSVFRKPFRRTIITRYSSRCFCRESYYQLGSVIHLTSRMGFHRPTEPGMWTISPSPTRSRLRTQRWNSLTLCPKFFWHCRMGKAYDYKNMMRRPIFRPDHAVLGHLLQLVTSPEKTPSARCPSHTRGEYYIIQAWDWR